MCPSIQISYYVLFCPFYYLPDKHYRKSDKLELQIVMTDFICVVIRACNITNFVI